MSDKDDDVVAEQANSAANQGVIAEAVSESASSKSELEHDKAAKDFSRTEKNGKLSMRVKVTSPFHDYYDGQAFSISAENATGPFDILPKHHNFISLLDPCELVIRNITESDQRIKISGGIMHVKADRVVVFLDI